MSEVIHRIDRAQQGDPKAAEELLALVYGDWRQCAARKLPAKPQALLLTMVVASLGAFVLFAAGLKPYPRTCGGGGKET
jgi:hypothetical protein